ncbi:PREDICTED: uncharacterized protein LOC105961120 [Erythranthe guttata]|uniref:uncharacterized protein LOC105961120 n=1 Tax=Erythranthe guttata TaxID=4155 RepID=UPI00064D8947|nr:PREDICTED: uncharacterized protein LOC105961120 [Erythranthe guttata]|eukprot:XP_012840817.1 PREDICTED: uncharacterized protein LOC105961120 [Erythranthe guttata]
MAANTTTGANPILPLPSSTPAPPSLPSSSSLVSIKLSDDNYLLWRAQLLPYLKGHNLFRFVDGTIHPPPILDPDSNPNPDYSIWLQQDQSVMSILISSLSESVIAHILDATTSREVWTILETLFAASSQANIMQTLFQLSTLKKGSDSISVYYRRAKLLMDSLAMAGKVISPSEFVVFLLAGLGQDYDSIVTSITTRADSLSPAQVYAHLLNHESRISHQIRNLTANTEFSANNSIRQSPQFQRGRGFHRGRHTPRGRGGRNRGGRSNFITPAQFTSDRPTCQVCLKPGHSAATCYHRYDFNYQPPPPPALSAHYTAAAADPSWFPDTAASHHFTNDFSNLSINPSEYKGSDQVRIGDGSGLPIHHVGSSNISSSTGFSNPTHPAPRLY